MPLRFLFLLDLMKLMRLLLTLEDSVSDIKKCTAEKFSFFAKGEDGIDFKTDNNMQMCEA